jgi:hypothetical protein
MELLRKKTELSMVSTNAGILQVESEKKLSRGDIIALLIAKAQSDAEFKQAILQQPREIVATVTEEGLGINILYQISEVSILQETPNTIYLMLPACHYGCMAPDPKEAPVESSGHCHVCGLPKAGGQDCSQAQFYPKQNKSLTRQEIEAYLIAKAQKEHRFKQQLLSEPTTTYINAVQEILGSSTLPEFLKNITEVRVVEENTTCLYIVFPAH